MDTELQPAGTYYYCAVCDLSFKFKSKYERHIRSEDHVMFEMCSMSADSNVDTVPSNDDIFDHSKHINDDTSEDSDGSDISSNDTNTDLSDGNFSDFAMDCICNDQRDYSPFPSKLFASLYFLLNSPKPMGESSLKFIWFMIEQISEGVPSLSAVKNFKLPGLSSPSKHFTAEGIPFYVNTISLAIQRCIGNPHSAANIKRYPVVSSGTFREMYHAFRWHNDTRFFSPMAFGKDGTQIFIHDCVSFLHPTLNTVVTGLVVKFYLKEISAKDVFVEVDVLLNLDQFKMAVPDSLVAHLAYGTLIHFETQEIPIQDVCEVCTTP